MGEYSTYRPIPLSLKGTVAADRSTFSHRHTKQEVTMSINIFLTKVLDLNTIIALNLFMINRFLKLIIQFVKKYYFLEYLMHIPKIFHSSLYL